MVRQSRPIANDDDEGGRIGVRSAVTGQRTASRLAEHLVRKGLASNLVSIMHADHGITMGDPVRPTD